MKKGEKTMSHIDQMPQLHTGSFLTKEQAEQFKEAFKNLTVVVRCKDCKYYDSFSQECRNGIDGIMTPNFYCGNAERKEGR